MKKGLLALCTLMLVGLSASAQEWGFGPKAGMNFSTMNGVERAETRYGVAAGMFAVREINSWMSLQSELLWNQAGYKLNEGVSEEYRINLDYLTMPLMAKFYLIGNFNVVLGAQFGYLLNANEQGDTADTSIKSSINKSNVDMLTGIAYDFCCGLILECRYTAGLSNVQNYNSGEQLRTGALQVMLGWQF